MPKKGKVYNDPGRPFLEDNFEPYTHGDYKGDAGVGAPKPDRSYTDNDSHTPANNPPQKHFDN